MAQNTLRIFGVMVFSLVIFCLGGVAYFYKFGQAEPSKKIATAPWKKTLFIPFLTMDQHRISLSQWKGKKLVINFWATWCEPCRKEIPALVKFYSENKQKDIEVIGIAMDFQQDVKKFMQRIAIPYPVVASPDESAPLLTIFGNRQGTLPFTVIINASQTDFEVITGIVDINDLNNRLNHLH